MGILSKEIRHPYWNTCDLKKNRLPSFYTVRRIVQGIDFSFVSKQFHRWASQYVTISKQEWVSIDGKVIGGTVTNANSSKPAICEPC